MTVKLPVPHGATLLVLLSQMKCLLLLLLLLLRSLLLVVGVLDDLLLQRRVQMQPVQLSPSVPPFAYCWQLHWC